MPVIKIREKIEEVDSPVTGQSNAVVVPLFVSSQRLKKIGEEWEYISGKIKPELYSSVSSFDDGEDIKIDGVEGFNPIGLGAMTIKDKAGAILDNSYYYIRSLLEAGANVYVYPIDLMDEGLLEEEITINNEKKAVSTFFNPTLGLSLDKINLPISVAAGADLENNEVPTNAVNSNNLAAEYLFTRYSDPGSDIIYSEIIRVLADKGYFDKLKDKMAYNFKFLTTGAHANAYYLDSGSGSKPALTGSFESLLKLCVALEDDSTLKSGRGDCLFTLDFSSDLTKVKLENGKSIYTAMQDISFGGSPEKDEAYGKFGFCTYPWVKKNISLDTIELPGSFAYLMAFMASTIINGNEDFAAIAGYRRGTVSNGNDLVPIEDLGDIDCHIFQSDSFSGFDYGSGDDKKYFNMTINPIIKYQDGTYKIKGNRVMSKPPVGTDGINPDSDNVKDCTYFLNVRHIIFDIKKECYMASDREQFEPNDDVTWTNFLNWVNPLLDGMINNRGLDWYSWKRLDTNGVKGLIKAQVTVKPIEAVESFDITVFVKNTDEEE